jgi:hypothetical protein
MSGPIEPTNVYRPGQSPAVQEQVYGSGQQGRTYIIYDDFGQGGGQQQGGRATRAWNRIPQQNFQANVGGPRFLANRSIVFNMWIVAMLIVGFDEWHNLGILPRPARLWDTSLFYGLLTIAGFVDPMVPLVNAFAIGYTIVLLMQYYQGNITPQGASRPQATTSASTPGSVGAGFTGPPPTPGANFPINTQLTGQ